MKRYAIAGLIVALFAHNEVLSLALLLIAVCVIVGKVLSAAAERSA